MRMKNGSVVPSQPLTQRRMLQAGELLDPDGRLIERGYATAPIKRYNRAQIRTSALRVKEWDYYLICSDYAALALTISDNGYLGLDSISLMDFEQKSSRTYTRMSAFPMGRRGLPAESGLGTVRASGRKHELSFRVQGGQRHLYGHAYDFGPGKDPLLFDIVLDDMPGDSMVIATPFKRKPYHFYYNQKINCLPAQGRVIWGKKEYVFSPSAAFGLLDWGRGVWPYCNLWYWASLSGIVEGKRLGLNLGYGFGDTTAATENMILYDGIAHKLGEVVFEIPRVRRRTDYLGEWRIRDAQGRLDLRFLPILDRAARSSALILKTDQHQVFGRYHGSLTLDHGQRLELDGLTGFAEKVYMRY